MRRHVVRGRPPARREEELAWRIAEAAADPVAIEDDVAAMVASRVSTTWPWPGSFHDTFLAADFAHPGDTIPPLLAAAQQCGHDGAALVRAIATAYEVQVDLTRASTCTPTGSTTWPTWVPRWRPASARCSACPCS